MEKRSSNQYLPKKGISEGKGNFKVTKKTSSSTKQSKSKYITEDIHAKIAERKAQKEKTIDEKLEEIIITETEQVALEKVFILLSNHKRHKKFLDEDDEGYEENVFVWEEYFEGKDVARVLRLLGLPLNKSEIDLMIWEVDDNLNGMVERKEFFNMYKRCIVDTEGLEPKSLFYMVQFLMFCKEGKYSITVEDTLELIYVRQYREDLDSEIRVIFGFKYILFREEEFTENGEEKEINFSEYLERISQRAIHVRQQKLSEKSKMKYTNLLKKGLENANQE